MPAKQQSTPAPKTADIKIEGNKGWVAVLRKDTKQITAYKGALQHSITVLSKLTPKQCAKKGLDPAEIKKTYITLQALHDAYGRF